MNRRTLPPIDLATLREAKAVAEASLQESKSDVRYLRSTGEPNPEVRQVLEEEALELWRKAHQGRRSAMYGRGCLVADDE